MSKAASDIKPPLAFRVGIVGHRPKRLPTATAALQARLQELLVEIKHAVESHHGNNTELYAEGAPALRALSPLSEGADRLFADAATKAGYALFGVFPFPASDYENDFPTTPASGQHVSPRADFDARLPGLPRFEMDGVRQPTAAEDRSYRNAGLVVNRQSDILIVVWDGDHQGKVGGTEDSMEAALRDGVPVIWVDAYGNHDWQVLHDPAEIPCPLERPSDIPLVRVPHEAPEKRFTPVKGALLSALASVVDERLCLPEGQTATGSAGRSISQQEAYQGFVLEKAPPRNKGYFSISAWIWSWCKRGLGRWKWPSTRKDPYTNNLATEWPKVNDPALQAWCLKLQEPFMHADQLSIHYGERYRASYIGLFLLGALAVLLAVLPMALGMVDHSRPEMITVSAELLFLLIIIFIWRRALNKRWQERWLDYRIVAELIRQMRYIAPSGGRRVLPRMGGHLSGYVSPSDTWMAWYVRAWERFAGLPTATMTTGYIEVCREQAESLATSQKNYHNSVVSDYHHIDHRLHTTAKVLGFLTIAACGLHLLGALLHFDEHMCWWPSGPQFAAVCAFLPALGATLAAINNQGEFKRTGTRSQAMAQRLGEQGRTLQDLKTARSGTQHSTVVADQASALTELMAQEAMGWRVIFMDRPVVPPA